MQRSRQNLMLIWVPLFVLGAGVGIYYLFQAVRKRSVDENRYDRCIYDAATRHNVPPLLVKAVIWRESKFDSLARGLVGEIGLMQIRPDMAVVDWTRDTGNPLPDQAALFVPELNIEIGTWYLSRGLREWDGYPEAKFKLALAYYNAGGTNARRWKPDNFRDDLKYVKIDNAVTREYVPAIINRWKKIYEKQYNARKGEGLP
jgi:soluble lytic murein transglycosylase